jgi:hypothetical protein
VALSSSPSATEEKRKKKGKKEGRKGGREVRKKEGEEREIDREREGKKIAQKRAGSCGVDCLASVRLGVQIPIPHTQKKVVTHACNPSYSGGRD